MNKKIWCFVAGKSGGHIIPCLTLAARQKEKDATTTVSFFTTCAPLDTKIIAQAAVDKHVVLPLTNLSVGKKIWRIPGTVWHLLQSLYISGKELRTYKKAYTSVRVITTGGFIALPVCFWAVLLNIPIDLYELNVVPGKATTWLARWATHVYICFEKTKQFLPQARAALVEYPVRFVGAVKKSDRVDACRALQFDAERKTIFVIGGSQGSMSINNILQTLITDGLIDTTKIQVIHQTGAVDATHWQQLYAQHAIPAIVFDYSDALMPYYMAADLIISRAGAGMLFELLFLKKQTIVIPLETAVNNHQLYNAQEMVIAHQRLFTMLRQQAVENDYTLLAREIRVRLNI